MSWRDRLTDAKRSILAAVLREHHGNRHATARSLRIGRAHLYRLLRRYGLEGVGRG